MSRNGSGVYSLPAGYAVVNGDTSDASQHTPILEDIATDLNTPRPIVAGGTGAGTAAAARTAFLVDAKNLSKSSAYTAVAADRSKLINCTASLTLSLTAAATLGDGWFIVVKASSGDVTVDPDSSETIDGAATFTIYEGQSAVVWCNGTAFLTSGTIGGAVSSITSASTNLNTLSNNQIVSFSDTATGAPVTGSSYDALCLQMEFSGQTTQIASIGTADPLWVRVDDGGGFSAWTRVITSADAASDSEAGIVTLVDEDDMASDSDTLVPTQQSVKAYVDATAISSARADVTIAGGLISAAGKGFIRLRSEGGAGTDTLQLINGGVDGQRLVLEMYVGEVITIEHGAFVTEASIRLAGGVDFTFGSQRDKIELIYSDQGAGTSNWHEISRSVNT